MSSSKTSPGEPSIESIEGAINVLFDDRLAYLHQSEGSLTTDFERLELLGEGLPRASEVRMMRDRLRPVVERALQPVREACAGIDKIPSEDLEARWAQLDTAETLLRRISEELSVVTQGGLVRAFGLDNGICRLADELLDEIGNQTVPWQRVVVPGPSNVSKDRTLVVQMDTTSGLWALPFAVHELGHFAVRRLENAYQERPGFALLSPEPPLAKELPDFAEELFADIFATYCLGPAYLAALVWSALPVDAWVPRPRMTHPAWGFRVRCAERIALAEYPELGWMTNAATDYWIGQVKAAGAALNPQPSSAALHDAFADQARSVLRETASTALFDPSRILDVEFRLREGQSPRGSEQLRTVICAAWAGRVRYPDSRNTIERAFAKWVASREGEPQ